MIYAGFVVAGIAFKVVLRAAFGLDGIVTGGAEQRVAPGPPGSCRYDPSVRFANL